MNPQRTEGEGFERQTWLGLHDQNISSSRAPSVSQTRAAAAGPTPLPAAVCLSQRRPRFPEKVVMVFPGQHLCVCVADGVDN